MPVEFLSDEQAAMYGRFASVPSQAELERFFFLDDADKVLVAKRRGDHNRLGFTLQLVTARFLGTFLVDPLDVPKVVVDYVAEQLGIDDASVVKAYVEREKTRFEHQWDICQECGWRDFAEFEAALVRWIDDRSWTTGDGPKAIFDGAVVWLRERKVLLPGVTTLVRLVARVRDAALQRLWDTLSALLTPAQARLLEGLLEVPDGARISDLERLRRGPTTVSGTAMVGALDRIAEIVGLGMGSTNLDMVPVRRTIELARYGMTGKAPALRRHPYSRKLATLLATVVYLEGKATDDALELFDVLMTNELMARAERESSKEKLRRYPRVSRDAAKCAAAVEVLLESMEWGTDVSLDLIWDAIENRVSRAELRVAVANLAEVLPPPDVEPNGEWRATLTERYPVVRRFLAKLCSSIKFGATAEAATILYALKDLPELIEKRSTKRVPTGSLDAKRVMVEVVPSGWWRPLVFRPGRPEGTVDRNAYVFCVLEQFHQRLKRRDIFAIASTRWADPRAQLLTGPAWDAVRGPTLNALQLPEEPDEKNVLDRLERFHQHKGRQRRGEAGIHGHGRPLRDRAIVYLLLSTGLRREELVTVNLDQLTPNTPEALRAARKAKITGVRGKGRTQRNVFLSADARQAVADYLEHERPTDIGHDSAALVLSAASIGSRRADGRLSPRSINLICEQIGRWHDAEQPDPTRHLSPLRPHDLRHSFAFALAAETGNDAYELQRRLGHQSQRYIDRYTNPPEDIAAGYVEQL